MRERDKVRERERERERGRQTDRETDRQTDRQTDTPRSRLVSVVSTTSARQESCAAPHVFFKATLKKKEKCDEGLGLVEKEEIRDF